MAEGSDNGNNSSSNSSTSSSTSSSSNSSTSSSSVSGDNGLGSSSDNGGNGGSSSTNSDSDASNTAPSAEAATVAADTSKSEDTGYSFSGAINASLADTVASLSLSKDAAEQAASRASFGSVPSSFGSKAADAAIGHFGQAALQGTMAGLAAHSGKAGLSVGLNAATNPTAIAAAFTDAVSKGYGMTTTAHNVGGMIGSHLGAAIGPVGAVVGGFLGTALAEMGLDALQARENEMARDVLEAHLGPLEGRRAATEMSDLGFAGFTAGLNNPSMSNLGGYTAGVIGQAEATAAAAANLGDPAAGVGNVSATSISGMDTSTSPGMGLSSAVSNSIANANAAVSTAAIAADRSGELGWGAVAPSVSAQEASMEALGGNINSIPTQLYGWLRAGLPVAAPSSTYKSSYWDGTRFVNMNDYRGYM